jgi:large subunit ribosomal protein L25
MASAEFNVALRENTGKGVARKLRAQGLVPAVVYGQNMEPCCISFEPKVLEKAIATDAGWNTLLTLKGAAPVEGQVAVLKHLELHPLRRNMMSADFHAIDLNKKVSFMVPVVTLGKSVGEKEGGSLQIIRHELEVICLPGAVPQAIEIDVTALEIGDVIHVEEVQAPDGVEIPHDVNFTVITVIGHKTDEETTDEEEPGED